MSISYGTIRRRYDQGLDSIVRLVIQLEDQIEDLMAMHVSAPQISIRRLSNHIKQLKQTLDNKDKELTESHQLNVQLQARIRELERSLEESAAEPVPVIKRDSHNSNQPPSLASRVDKAQMHQKFTKEVRFACRRSARSRGRDFIDGHHSEPHYRIYKKRLQRMRRIA